MSRDDQVLHHDGRDSCHESYCPVSRYIKKIKMELGEDKDLKFVMACADYIPPLQPFRGSCKPVWLLVAAGNTKNICSASKNICSPSKNIPPCAQARLCL